TTIVMFRCGQAPWPRAIVCGNKLPAAAIMRKSRRFIIISSPTHRSRQYMYPAIVGKPRAGGATFTLPDSPKRKPTHPPLSAHHRARAVPISALRDWWFGMVLGRLGRRQSFLRIYSRRQLLANAVMADSRPLPSFVVIAGVWASHRAPKSLMMGFFPAHCAVIGIMLLLRLVMIQMEPVMTRKTISMPKARARILFVLSGPLPRCRKNTRWTPICANASTINPTGMPGAQSKLVCATTKEAIVARIASTRPTVYDR